MAAACALSYCRAVIFLFFFGGFGMKTSRLRSISLTTARCSAVIVCVERPHLERASLYALTASSKESASEDTYPEETWGLG